MTRLKASIAARCGRNSWPATVPGWLEACKALPTVMIRLLTVVLMTAAFAVAPSAQTKPTPDALARSLQQRYQSIRDFSASFTHSYRGGVLRTQSVESGTVVVKKPGLMRWLYTSPEKKEFVSDGKKIYSYLPQ